MSATVHTIPGGRREHCLRALGVSRMADNNKAVLVHFSRRLTDDEVRFFHEVCERSAPLMEGH